MKRRMFTWRLYGTLPPKLNRDEVLNTLRFALHEWEKVCHIGFQQADLGMETDITFWFGAVTDTKNTAEHRSSAGKHVIVFNHLLQWSTFKPGFKGWLGRVFQKGKDLLTFTLHETGHALGLHHIEVGLDPFSVMHPFPEVGGYVTKPSLGDGIEARKIYPSPVL